MICRWVPHAEVAAYRADGWHASRSRGHHEHYAIFMWMDEKMDSTAKQICLRAADLVSGDRQKTHGDKEPNFKAIADIWSAYLANRSAPDTPLRPSEAADLMELMKVARRLNGELNLDDYVDAAGYAGCAGEIASAEHLRQIES